MFRRLMSLKLANSTGLCDKGRILTGLRRHPILWACVSSGLLYRGYVALPQNHNFRISQKRYSFACLQAEYVLHSDGQNSSSTRGNDIRLDRLLDLRQTVETELPHFFEKSLFDVRSRLFDPSTVVYVQNTGGHIHRIRSRSWLNAALIAARAYFSARSFGRRLEVIGVLCDKENWKLEVSFRIVLLPAPSIKDSRLPSEQLIQKLEQNSRWHEFRAIFSISQKGEVSEVHLTQFTPPRKAATAIRNLKQLSMLKRLAPSLSGSRRLPNPMPFTALHPLYQNYDLTPLDFLWICHSQKLNSCDDPASNNPLAVFFPPEPLDVYASYPTSVFDRLIQNSSLRARTSDILLFPSLNMSQSIRDETLLPTVRAIQLNGEHLCANSLFDILPYQNWFDTFSLSASLLRPLDISSSPVSSSTTSEGSSSSQSLSLHRSTVQCSFLPWLIRELPNAAAFYQLHPSSGAFCQS